MRFSGRTRRSRSRVRVWLSSNSIAPCVMRSENRAEALIRPRRHSGRSVPSTIWMNSPNSWKRGSSLAIPICRASSFLAATQALSPHTCDRSRIRSWPVAPSASLDLAARFGRMLRPTCLIANPEQERSGPRPCHKERGRLRIRCLEIPRVAGTSSRSRNSGNSGSSVHANFGSGSGSFYPHGKRFDQQAWQKYCSSRFLKKRHSSC